MFSGRTYKNLLLLLLCFIGITTQTSCASKPHRFGIIFTNNSNGSWDIYRIPDNIQGKVEQLTFTPTIGEYVLSASKNGDEAIFTTDFYTNADMQPSDLAIEKLRHLYLLDTTNKNLVDITKVLEDQYPQLGRDFFMDWSPDQKQFVRIIYRGTDYEIQSFLELVDIDGKNRKDILIPAIGEIPSLINSIEWSPDGRKFVLTQGVIGVKQQLENPGAAILVYDLKSEKIIQITDYKDHCFPREWSPTSQQIIATCSYVPPYSEGFSVPESVRILDVENPGQPYERISFSPCYDPSWSPDGKQIAFVCDKGTEQVGLFIVNSDGSGIREVKPDDTENIAFLKEPTWSPDGTQIVYVAGIDSMHTNIFSIHSDGSSNRSLTNRESFYSVAAVYP